MVTAKELKVAITLTDQSFKKKLAEINKETTGFNRRLKTANDRVNDLDQTLNKFNQITLPDDIKVNVTVNEAELTSSINEWIKKDLTTFKGKIPITVDTNKDSKLVKNLDKFFTEKYKNKLFNITVDTNKDSKMVKGRGALRGLDRFFEEDYKNKIFNITVDSTKKSKMVLALEKFFENYIKKINVEIDTSKNSTIVKSLEDFFSDFESKINARIQSPEMKTIQPEMKTSIMEKETTITSEENENKKIEILKKIQQVLESLKTAIGTGSGTDNVISILNKVSSNTSPTNPLKIITGQI